MKSEALQGKIRSEVPAKKNPRIVIYDLYKSECRSREKEKEIPLLLAKGQSCLAESLISQVPHEGTRVLGNIGSSR
ncbi:hypothetical protein CEXT_568321 [Caerostris extrusa]|uniref:Uncharacterized protein n=1 Tax=Caerostris extrusa TaxID=172846 RepID=A0AAV4XVV8_CAEEX|nr:hypothetical protein CEXT_568321 [Caerostris extrusa]